MTKIKNEDGILQKDMKQILKIQEEYYRKLYTANPKTCFTLQNTNRKKISEIDRNELESEITLEEIKTAVMHFKPDKTPGVDGIIGDFYQQFWHLIAKYYYDAIKKCMKNGRLHISACRGALSLILKKGRNLNEIKNWHPLTMLTLDYKILSKGLDNRLKRVLPSIIVDYQTGFMEGRNILNNILKLMDIMSEAQRKQISVIVMTIDFDKCFDMIEHEAVQGALKYFGFGPVYSRWVSVLFQDFELCTQNNGFISNWIKPT